MSASNPISVTTPAEVASGLPVRVLGEEPGLGLPNQHAKACPRFQTMHCWCPPATGPGQPHLFGFTFYRRAKPAAVPCTCKNWPGNSGWTHEAACPVAGAVMTADEPYNLSEAEKHLVSAAVKSYVEADAALDVLVGEVAAKLQSPRNTWLSTHGDGGPTAETGTGSYVDLEGYIDLKTAKFL